MRSGRSVLGQQLAEVALTRSELVALSNEGNRIPSDGGQIVKERNELMNLLIPRLSFRQTTSL